MSDNMDIGENWDFYVEDEFKELCLNHFLRTQFRRKQTPQEAFKGLGENMKTTKAIVCYRQLVATIKYENVALEYGLEVELEDGEDWRRALDTLRQALKDKLTHDLKLEVNDLVGGPGYGG